MVAKNNYFFGLVGCGNIGKKHAELIKNYGTLAAVCDNLPEKAQQFANYYACNHYQSLDEMLKVEKSIQIISICTPNYLHATHSIHSLKAGLHVLCEKPMALTLNDCKEMIATSNQENKLLHIVKQNRFNPTIIYLKHLLEQKRLGNIFSISMQVFWNREGTYYENTWRGKSTTDGGILFTQFSHFLDILIHLLGEVKEVEVRGRNFNHLNATDFEDTIVAILTFKTGILGSLHFSTCAYQSNREGSLSILAEKGGIKIGGQYLNTIEYHNIENLDAPILPNSNDANDYGHYKGSMSNHHKVYEKLLNALNEKDMLFDSLDESLLTVDLIQKMHESLLKNKN